VATPEEKRRAAALLEEDADRDEELQEVVAQLENKTASFDYGNVLSELEEINKLSNDLGINASDARKRLNNFPREYIVRDQTIPDLVKSLRNARRKLKGENRDKMSKSIDTLIDAYSEHLEKCITSITWLSSYQEPLRKMKFNERDLQKLYKMKDLEQRREVVDSLCKYWEAEQLQKELSLGKQYAIYDKEMRLAKKSFRNCLSKVTDQSITKSKKERIEDFIVKMVCEKPGIGAKQIHENMPSALHKSCSPNSISQKIKKLDIVNSNGSYYKFSSEIKKNIWAYTAAFIDSDGYITMDRNYNPRIGLVATGERGRTFMEEMHKSIGFGRLHLNQKSPQDTRPVNRLNFYSQDDVHNLLTKCLPHFKLKKGNAELLLELVRIKKSFKKQDWYKQRCEEIFKLMKWENHKDHVGFDFEKEGIYKDDIQKYRDNCKMSVMDELEGIGTVVKSVDEAIDELEEIVDEFDLSREEWESVDDASDYLFEHKVKDKLEKRLRHA
jgi:hypothetical protein|tara:strand:- start:51 stop:1544 length:1494 start_codon:yes stop_codon:yes gene_type:complete